MISKNATPKELAQIETEDPEDIGVRWKAIPHLKLVKVVRKVCESRGWKINDERISLTRDRTTGMAAAFQIDSGRGDLPFDATPWWGITNSNDRRLRIRMYGGVAIPIGDDLAGVILTRDPTKLRHSYGMKLKKEIGTAIEYWLTQATKFERKLEQLGRIKIRESMYNHILIETGRRKIMPWSRLGWMDQSFQKDLDGHFGNCWLKMLAAFGLNVQFNPAMSQMDQMYRFRRMMLREVKVRKL